MGGMELSSRMAVGLALLALPLPMALAVQPLRHWRSLVGRAALLLLAPLAMVGQGMLAMGMALDLAAPAAAATAKLAALVLLYAVLAAPAALLAALLLGRAEPSGLHQALAGVGVSPVAQFWRLTVPALAPGLLLGWVAGVAPALAAVVLLWMPWL
jgi:hypothetical protein